MDRYWSAAVLVTATIASGTASAETGVARYKCSSPSAYAGLEAASAKGAAAFETALLDAIGSGACALLPAGTRRVAQVPPTSTEETFPPPRGIAMPRR